MRCCIPMGRVRSLGGEAFCSVSPERCALSSFTYAKRSSTQTLRVQRHV